MTVLSFVFLVLVTIFVLYLIDRCIRNPQTANILRIIVFVLVVLFLLVAFGIIPNTVLGAHIPRFNK